MSRLRPEAGYIIVALTRVPLGALLLSTKTKLLVFIAPLSIGPGRKAGLQVTHNTANPDESHGPPTPLVSCL